MWQLADTRRAGDLDGLLQDLEQRLGRLSRMVRASRAAPAAVDRVGDAVAATFNDVADRFRGRARTTSREAVQLGDDVLQAGNDVLRKLTHEVEQRPLLVLAVAVAVGALAVGIFARRA